MDGLADFIVNAEPVAGTYRWVLRAASVFLIVLGITTFAAPDRARAFLGAQASTLFINSVEGVLRLIVGVALIGFARGVAAPEVLSFAGAFLALSAVAILILPGIHKGFAAWAVPFALNILAVYGAGALVLGLALAWFTSLPASGAIS
jgi:hypothetical protein